MRRVWRVMTFGLLIVAMMATVAAPAGAKNQVERPYKGSERVIVEIDLASCNEFFVCAISTVSDGGTSSHLGKTSTTSQGFIVFTGFCELSDGSAGSGFTASGTYTTTAANGDTIVGLYANGGCADGDGVIPGHIAGTQTIIGGTGRFENASGSTVTSGDNIGPLSWVGTLTY